MSVIRFDEDGRSIVDTLRAVLVDAEAGKITCLLLAAGRTEGESGGAFCPGEGVLTALGEIRTVEARALEWLCEINGGRL